MKIELKYLKEFDGEKFLNKKVVLFWNIVPLATPSLLEIQISDFINFKSFDNISIDPIISNGLHYSYILNFSDWLNKNKYFRIKAIIGNNEIFSNTIKIYFEESKFLSLKETLLKLPGYRFYNSNEESNLGIILGGYISELNNGLENIFLLKSKFLFENVFADTLFSEFDKLNKWDKIALKKTLNELKNIGNTRLGLTKLFNILVGNNPIIEFNYQKPNIIIGDENQFFYVIDQGIPPDFIENPPIRSRENLMWGLTIKYFDPKSILVNKEEYVKRLIREFICYGYEIKLQQI